MRPLLEGQNITRWFDGVVALDGVNFQVAEGEIVGLLGPNGSGKTTLINVISGRLSPTAGRIRFAGHDITGRPAYEICHLGIARTFQIVKPFDRLTVRDNVALGALFGRRQRIPLETAREEALDLLARVDLVDKADDAASTLSMGQLKWLELARALATRPRLLLLDEVSAGLTPAGGIALRSLLARLRDDELTILSVEHALHALADIADRLIVLDKGRIVTEGPVDQVLEDPQVMEAYIGE